MRQEPRNSAKNQGTVQRRLISTKRGGLIGTCEFLVELLDELGVPDDVYSLSQATSREEKQTGGEDVHVVFDGFVVDLGRHLALDLKEKPKLKTSFSFISRLAEKVKRLFQDE